MDSLAECTNTFAQQHFGFSPAALTDSVHNIIVENWGRMVEEIVNDPQLPEKLKNKEVSQELMKSLLKDNLLRNALAKFEDNVKRYAMRIPEHVTLPEHEANLEVASNFDSAKLEEEISSLEKELVRKRVTLAHQDAEERDLHDAITILKKMNDVIAIGNEETLEDMTMIVEKMNISGVQNESSIVSNDEE